MTEIYRKFNRGDRVKIDPESEIYKSIKPDNASRMGTITTGKPLQYQCYGVLWDGRKTPATIYCNYLIKVSE